MNFFLEDPILFWLVWCIFTMAGAIIGWTLRANTTEKEVRMALGRIEQEKNTLARLYTQVKHQHDLREADFRRATLELDKLRSIIQMLENERAALLPDAPANAARIAKAEAAAAHYAQKVAALEVLTGSLNARNNTLTEQLSAIQQEMKDWDNLYLGFKQTQERLLSVERQAIDLETERDQLKVQLQAAHADIEQLTLELQQKSDQPATKAKSSRKGHMPTPQLDDLRAITGMSPYVERLAGMGISTFTQISRWDDDTVIAVAKSLDISPGKIYRDDWVGQASKLAAERR